MRSQEEQWVISCYKFIEENDKWYWYTVPQELALAQIMKYSGGALNPTWARQKIKELYESIGKGSDGR